MTYHHKTISYSSNSLLKEITKIWTIAALDASIIKLCIINNTNIDLINIYFFINTGKIVVILYICIYVCNTVKQIDVT